MKMLMKQAVPYTQYRRIIPLLAIVISVFICASMLMVGCKSSARPDDNLEPNDDFDHATVLTIGQALTGRANQWNKDVFAFTLEEKGTIVFSLESLGLEDCAAFTVTGPDGVVLYQDAGDFCNTGYRENPAVQAEGITFREIEEFGYEITIAANISGTYYLSIYERSQADNVLPFSWDYRLMVIIDSPPVTSVSANIIT